MQLAVPDEDCDEVYLIDLQAMKASRYTDALQGFLSDASITKVRPQATCQACSPLCQAALTVWLPAGGLWHPWRRAAASGYARVWPSQQPSGPAVRVILAALLFCNDKA